MSCMRRSRRWVPRPLPGRAAASAVAALAMLSFVAPATAQDRSIAGTVVSAATLTPIEGAQVMVQGATTGVLTDVSGRFRLTNLTTDQVTIVVRRLRYQPLTETVRTGTTNLRLLLNDATVRLDEVVITGTALGTQQRAIGNAVSSINASQELERSGVGDVGNLINARAAGVLVTPGSGRAGSGPGIAIRGRSTISLSQQPLLYIDGVRVANDVATGPRWQGGAAASRMNDISPEDIESIEIIKGPAAATIYGTEASNGVIQIITKRGRASDKPRWGVNLRQGTTWFQNAEGRLPTSYGKDAAGNIVTWNGLAQEKARGLDIFRPGRVQSYGANVGGGSNLVTYYLSSVYDKDKGIEPNNSLTRFTGNANVHVAPGENLDINSRIGYVTGTTHLGSDYGLGAIAGIVYGGPAAASGLSRGFGFGVPPEVVWGMFDNTQEINRFTGSATMNHRPASWYSQRLIVGLDQTSEDNQSLTNFAPAEWRPLFSAAQGRGSLLQDLRNISFYSGDYSGTAKLNLSSAIVSSTSFGGQYYRRRTRTSQVSGREFPAPGLKTAAAAAIKDGSQDFFSNTTIGLYAQQQFGLNDRMFLTGALRVDNNSAFGDDFDFAYYPKVSATWVLSEEPFFRYGFVNALKLRGAFGVSGLQPDVFTALRTFSPTTGSNDQAIVTPQLIGNSELKPERGQEIEVGFEAEMFNGRTLIAQVRGGAGTPDLFTSRELTQKLLFELDLIREALSG